MQNLHAPTVPSGPTSGPAGSTLQTAGLSFQQLQSKKDNLEAEIRALSSVLDSVSLPPVSADNILTLLSTMST
jgi:26S proteasome non-ATPase regulatory subunit 9